MEGNTPIGDAASQVDDISESIVAAVEDAPNRIDDRTHEMIHDLIGRVEALSNTLGERLGENSVRHSELVTMLNNVLEKVSTLPDTGEKEVKEAVEEAEKVIDNIEETPISPKKRNGMLMKRGKK